jgi:hypothetical protein
LLLVVLLLLQWFLLRCVLLLLLLARIPFMVKNTFVTIFQGPAQHHSRWQVLTIAPADRSSSCRPGR